MSELSGTASAECGPQKSPTLRKLKVRSEFLRVAAARRRWAAPGLVLQVAEAPAHQNGEADIGVGFTASRKVGDAVARNRARRRLREAARRVLPVHAKPGCDYVVIARAGTPRRSFDGLVGDLETALRKLDAWRAARPTCVGDGRNR